METLRLEPGISVWLTGELIQGEKENKWKTKKENKNNNNKNKINKKNNNIWTGLEGPHRA